MAFVRPDHLAKPFTHMPINAGVSPDEAYVDIVFRCGKVVRTIDPKTYRWTLNDPEYPPDYDYDIERWQPRKA